MMKVMMMMSDDDIQRSSLKISSPHNIIVAVTVKAALTRRLFQLIIIIIIIISPGLQITLVKPILSAASINNNSERRFSLNTPYRFKILNGKSSSRSQPIEVISTTLEEASRMFVRDRASRMFSTVQ